MKNTPEGNFFRECFSYNENSAMVARFKEGYVDEDDKRTPIV